MAPRKKTAASEAAPQTAPQTATPLTGAVATAPASNLPLPVPVALKDFRITKYDPAGITEVLKENFGGEKLDRFALTHIRIPSGGGLAWTVPTLEGPKPFETIEGVILAHQLQRAYWRESYGSTGGGSPPDCSSVDAEFGRGDPGGPCGNCPFSEFGTAVDDKGEPTDGQACRLVRIIYVLRPNSLVPAVIPLPPSSLKAFVQYRMTLTDEGYGTSQVVTKFSLAQDKSGKGITFSKVKLSVASILDQAEIETWITPVKRMVQGITAILNPKDFEGAS